MTTTKTKYLVAIKTLVQGEIPAITVDGKPETFDTELEAQKAIAESQINRLQAFIEQGEDYTTFDDAMETEEYVIPVSVSPEGIITNESGKIMVEH